MDVRQLDNIITRGFGDYHHGSTRYFNIYDFPPVMFKIKVTKDGLEYPTCIKPVERDPDVDNFVTAVQTSPNYYMPRYATFMPNLNQINSSMPYYRLTPFRFDNRLFYVGKGVILTEDFTPLMVFVIKRNDIENLQRSVIYVNQCVLYEKDKCSKGIKTFINAVITKYNTESYNGVDVLFTKDFTDFVIPIVRRYSIDEEDIQRNADFILGNMKFYDNADIF